MGKIGNVLRMLGVGIIVLGLIIGMSISSSRYGRDWILFWLAFGSAGAVGLSVFIAGMVFVWMEVVTDELKSIRKALNGEEPVHEVKVQRGMDNDSPEASLDLTPAGQLLEKLKASLKLEPGTSTHSEPEAETEEEPETEG